MRLDLMVEYRSTMSPCEPESDELQKQVKQRLTMSAPQMVPILNSDGKPRKAVKKYTLTLNK